MLSIAATKQMCLGTDFREYFVHAGFEVDAQDCRQHTALALSIIIGDHTAQLDIARILMQGTNSQKKSPLYNGLYIVQ